MRRILTYLLLFFTLGVQAQFNDAGLWVYFNLEKDLPDKFTTGVELENRLNENFSEVNSLFAQPWIMKEWSDAFSTTLSYRMQLSRDLDNFYDGQDRMNLDIKYKQKVKEVGIQYRFRLQRRLGLINTEKPFRSSSAMRHRLKFGYDLNKKWKVAIAGEGFYALQRENTVQFSDVRFKISARYRIKKRNYLTIGYLFQREFNTANPPSEFIGVVGYTLMIK